jgi:hypothetical protein
VDELFSKLKSTEIDYHTQAKIKNPSAPTMALISGNGSSSSANPSQISIALSSLVSVTEEQLEALGDNELALVISWFSRFHNNRLNHRRGGAPKEGCYGCGDIDHFVAHCPKKNKHSSDKYDSNKRKNKHEYTSKHKSKEGFNKEVLKKKYFKKAKVQERAFLASLSNLDNDTDDDRSSSSSNDESERKRKDKLTGLCFVADSTHGGFCTMAVDAEMKANKDMVPIDDDTTEVTPSIDNLVAELDIMTDTLVSQDKLLKRVARERKEFKDKLEITLKELEEAKKVAVVVSDEVECDECAVHMTNLSELQSKYVVLLDENDELKSRSTCWVRASPARACNLSWQRRLLGSLC